MDHLQETLRKENQQSVRLRASLFASEREYRLLRNLPNASISARWAYAPPRDPSPAYFTADRGAIHSYRNTLAHTFLPFSPSSCFVSQGREGVVGDRVESAMKTKLSETNAFKLRLESQLAQTNHELALREESLRRLEDELEAKRAPLAINKECTARRSERPGREDIHDEVMALLQGEMKMLAEHCNALEQRVAESRAEVEELRALKQQIEDDIEDKRRGLEIDAQCLRLRQEARALMSR